MFEKSYFQIVQHVHVHEKFFFLSLKNILKKVFPVLMFRAVILIIQNVHF